MPVSTASLVSPHAPGIELPDIPELGARDRAGTAVKCAVTLVPALPASVDRAFTKMHTHGVECRTPAEVEVFFPEQWEGDLLEPEMWIPMCPKHAAEFAGGDTRPL